MANILDKVQGKISDVVGDISKLAIGDGSIDGFSSTISKHSGLSQNNRFNVIMTPPNTDVFPMNVPDVMNSLLTGSFDLRNLLTDPRDISFLATRAAFPSWNLSTFEYQTYEQVNKFPYSVVQEDLTLSFLCTNDYYVKKLLDGWMNAVMNVGTHIVNYKQDYVTDIVVSQLNEKGIPFYSYKFINAYPLIETAIEFEQGGTEFVQFDVTFAYDKFFTDDLAEGGRAIISNGFGKLNVPGGGTLASKVGSFGTKRVLSGAPVSSAQSRYQQGIRNA